MLDTGSSESRKSFISENPQFIRDIEQLHKDATENKKIEDKISSKFKIKNTCGYEQIPLADFNDPIDIILAFYDWFRGNTWIYITGYIHYCSRCSSEGHCYGVFQESA